MILAVVAGSVPADNPEQAFEILMIRNGEDWKLDQSVIQAEL